MIEGIPTQGKQVKIVNKLNNMAITVSQGWHGTKLDSLIVQRPDFPQIQTFKIIQKAQSDAYFIEVAHKDLLLSTKSGWGEMLYSEAKVERFNELTNQVWRIVPYDAVMFNEKDQQKHVFQYVPSLAKPEESNNESKSQSTSQQTYPLGYEFESGIHLDYKFESSKQPFFKLGYEFQSGNHLNHAYDEQKYREQLMNLLNKDGNRVKSGLLSNDAEIPCPVRFPIKEKNNTLPIDKDTKGWFFIENVKYNLVLEIQGGIDEPGMGVVLNTLYGNRNQLWKFV